MVLESIAWRRGAGGGGEKGVGLLYIRRNDYGSIEATDVLIL